MTYDSDIETCEKLVEIFLGLKPHKNSCFINNSQIPCIPCVGNNMDTRIARTHWMLLII